MKKSFLSIVFLLQACNLFFVNRAEQTCCQCIGDLLPPVPKGQKGFADHCALGCLIWSDDDGICTYKNSDGTTVLSCCQCKSGGAVPSGEEGFLEAACSERCIKKVNKTTQRCD